MRDDKLFAEHYEPRLLEQGIDNVILRVYNHIKGFQTDDPTNSTKIIFTPRAEVDERLTQLSLIFGKNRGIAITSLISHGNLQKYLFLLDCGLVTSAVNELGLLNAFRRSPEDFPALSDGMLLRTQESYHVVGFKPLTREEWLSHMGKALLLKTDDGTPIADPGYIGHSIDRGYGSLRISDYLGKPTPDFVCTI